MKKVSKEPLISVIIPLCNVKDYLKRCVDSVIGQSYRNLQVVLVDDGSTDGSEKICDNYVRANANIEVIHKKRSGVSDARNIGISRCKGEYVVFVDADDFAKKDCIEILYKTLIKNKTSIAVADCSVRYDGGIVYENSTGKEEVVSREEFYERMLWGDRDLDNGPWAKLYKRCLFDGVQYPSGKLYEDTATTYKLIEKCERIAIISKPLYCYMKRKNSITQGPFNKNKLELLDATSEMTEYIRKKYPKLADACDRKMMWAYLSTLSQLATSSTRYRTIEKRLVGYIRKNGKKVLRFPRTSRRDRLGIRCAFLGFRFYKHIWRFYLKIKGKY